MLQPNYKSATEHMLSAYCGHRFKYSFPHNNSFEDVILCRTKTKRLFFRSAKNEKLAYMILSRGRVIFDDMPDMIYYLNL